MPWMSFHTRRPRPPRMGDVGLFPTDHGEGEPVVAGKHVEVIDRLIEAGGAVPPSAETGYTVPFDPEVFKQVALDLLDGAGVRYLLHAFASGVRTEGRAGEVVFETKSGPLVLSARATVDCTGDGDIAAAAGAPFEIGRERDGLVQPMTLMFRMVGYDEDAFGRYVAEHPDQWRSVHGLWDLVEEATAAGDLDLPREDILFFGTAHPGEVAVNSTRVSQVFGTDVFDLTHAEAVSHRQMAQVAAFLRDYVPGFGESYVVQSGVQVGVRETRRILGDYLLTGEDILIARKFDDVIARGTYPVDIHNPNGRGTVLRSVPAGDAYDIPLRCLLPRDVDDLLTAGRCISGTHEAHSSYRVTPTAMATGQAAGVCAALAATSGRPPRQVEVAAVQAELVRQGADLGARRREVGTRGGRAPAGRVGRNQRSGA
ncbi:FAD dependent oxidoreductase [Geodermatophilus ruber]|uniref:FAD dependent oxidoreductase n=2 Tax=Geodermatophilus ruber TaxID=504800 RepID=A0A1I4ACY6_9ACTN|nr:FAD dependent oxidoreductase [Geodermatophilus ruber]